MTKTVKIVVPLHTYVPRKTKEDRRYLLNLNAYRNWQGHENNNIKKAFHEDVKEQLEKIRFDHPVEVTFQLFKGSKRRTDKQNFSSVLSKFLYDSMTTYGCWEDDNDDQIKTETLLPTEIDKENPRAEFVFTEIGEN